MDTHHPAAIAKRSTKETYNRSSDNRVAASGRKFMLSLRESVYDELRKVADQRGLKIQGLIRAVIVPEWQIAHPIINAEDLRHETSIPERESVVEDSASISAWPRIRGTVEAANPRKVVSENRSHS